MITQGPFDDRLGRILEDLEEDEKINMEINGSEIRVLYSRSPEKRLSLFKLHAKDMYFEFYRGLIQLEKREELLGPLIKYINGNNCKTNLD